ncbi:response regulator transcription factor [Paenibacillus thiaminolyticus]|uniref:Response regulator transcription factor n=1 Tax=Paenibacillus thiaminolyticus TaxID=49283 RepID=A0AAP9J0T9_PANTH|nr:response regulator transcription factor [Paenibacillus thiaminolyticus]MCY9533691.1 response regulator transcription factor [Paenibacillus thiaminolyticus]MCY9600913.1 response regulator transcription factor [Paenibacillus thiaminolyticus]MCY9607742.1 response regulator transcription factor [Paenibacillus thiaminolyticus]MCY9611541.1 response regulator transcription factor [Paenibacillus thiaminolyticus]MCY9617188.1 response regulator transcription factor [Paenibacillus thiaminolyticus]
MIRIVIAEDQRMLRGALASLLDLEDDIEVVGQAGDGDEALALIARLKPDVCLMDIEMPAKSGLDVAEELKRQRLNCRVIILTTFGRPGYFERAVKAGVQGYLLKDEPSERLAAAIRSVMRGEREISPELAFAVIRKEDNPLTEREREILKLAAEGRTANEIASALYLSYGTVRNYLSSIMSKLEARTRIEAIENARSKGWL